MLLIIQKRIVFFQGLQGSDKTSIEIKTSMQ
jgi:hypothetical protein